MRSPEAGRPFSTTEGLIKQKGKAESISAPTPPIFDAPFLRQLEYPTLPAFEPIETVEAADPLARELLKLDIEAALQHRGNDASMSGDQFLTFTASMAELVGGVRTTETNQLLATLDHPFSNVSKITFDHKITKEGDSLKEYARVTINTSGENPRRINYEFGHHQAGENLSTPQVEKSGDPQTDADTEDKNSLYIDSSIGNVLRSIYSSYIETSEDPKPELEEQVLATAAEEDSFTRAKESPVDIFRADAHDPRLVGAGTK